MRSYLPGVSFDFDDAGIFRASTQAVIDDVALASAIWRPLPHQVPPPGAWDGWLMLAGRGAGKALALDTPLPTPTGWTTMAEIDVGDQLLDDAGRPCVVTATSPVIPDRRCFRVSFSDGAEIVADAEHRWLVWTHRFRKQRGCGRPIPPSVMTTDEMVGQLRQRSARGDLNLAVPVALPLELPDADLPLDPYVLGVWLGDGSSWFARLTSMDHEVVSGVEAAGFSCTPMTRQNSGRAVEFSVRAADGSRSGSLHGKLRLLGVMGNKHIPGPYLRAGWGQRLRLLQGLMDTDGSVDTKGCCEFSGVKRRLVEDVAELVRSLGWKVTVSESATHGPWAVGSTRYRLRFNPDVKVATVGRKLCRLSARGRQASRHTHRMVLAIEPVDSVPVKCVAVDSPNRLYLAGRHFVPTHNTDACSNFINEHVKGAPCLRGPVPHRVGIVAPTLGDAASACFSGPSGIRAHEPGAQMVTTRGGTVVRWPNGSEGKLFGAHTEDDVDRLRAGGNRCVDWYEELAAWRWLEEAWDQAAFGLRVGPHPQWVASTTPKPRPLIKKLASGGGVGVIVVLRGVSMYDNPHLTAKYKAILEERYAGTNIGAQELYGQLIDQDENALWSRELLDEHRVFGVPELSRVAVGVDPSGGAGEQGIVVVGKQQLVVVDGGRRVEAHGYVLADRTCHLPPAGWGRRSVEAAVEFEADAIVVEVNFGGDMAVAVIQGAADALGVSIPIHSVTASRGKRVRAEPVAALSSRGRWHHVGRFEHLEDQMCTWTPEMGYSPDRLDAAVWPPWWMGLVSTSTSNAVGRFGGSVLSRTRLG